MAVEQSEPASEMRIGLISDTHGLLRPEAVSALSGVTRILHAGDIGSEAVLRGLGLLAPVTAVRGNMDRIPPMSRLPALQLVECGGLTVLLTHDLGRLDVDPVAAGARVVVSGHSHRPDAESRDGVLYVNPGSAGPRRFQLPVSVAILTVRRASASVSHVALLSQE